MPLRQQTPAVILKKGRDKSIRNRHPWIFSGAVAALQGAPASGQTVAVRTSDGRICGRGAYSPQSQIAVRLWSFDPEEEVSEIFFRTRLENAVAARGVPNAPPRAGAGRLVYAESDHLPGLIVDRYADYLVCQFLSAGAEHWKATIVDILKGLTACKGIYERSDAAVRKKEGLQLSAGLLAGAAPPEVIEIGEGPCRFAVDIRQGHKTGFYLDQRDNRSLVARYLKDAEVLDCFGYTGGFTVAALRDGAASATLVESSAHALAFARHNLGLNRLEEKRVLMAQADVFDLLRRYGAEGRVFDAVILDPPKFARSAADVKRAARAYKDINLAALKLIKTGGLLVTFSCSQHMDSALFQKIVAYAALDARREVQILQRLHQAPDHPVGLYFPEGEYLKGMICRVESR